MKFKKIPPPLKKRNNNNKKNKKIKAIPQYIHL